MVPTFQGPTRRMQRNHIPERIPGSLGRLLEDRRVYAVAARRGRKLGPSIRIRSALVRMRLILAVPCHGLEFLVVPLGLHLGAAPLVAKVVQHVDQAALAFVAAPLRDVEIRVAVQDAAFATGVAVCVR